ncbi:PREDICTED: deoxynucleotidyltransferase terminal-interacting protein 2 [Nanorana parkeri]|uniref:deoxynucleotidyltransferase terminal-interacting protein 2 n=1 Tax=Nanorana parkeri TaxID=125878 RepID=UPI0008549876|nr:PREDICTED: deoxynucleotidyltransferase terminal-interacting protein 2 [Nanorana parkeri]
MVATRRGTRVESQEEAVGSGGDQTAVEPATPASPKRAQRPVKSDTVAQKSGGNSQDQGDSTSTVGSPTKNDSTKGPSQVVTRSRHKSGQSDADVSEAESTTSNSSTRVTRSRQSLGNVTDSARKLRSQRSAFITEPILESKEDELSEAESNCSSVSTRASRASKRIRASASLLTRARSRKSALPSETVSDHSEAESNCSSVSGLQNTAVRSRRTSEATRPLSVNRESQKDEISEAESCNSDFVSQPRTRRSSRQIQSKPKADAAKSVSEASSQEQESPKKQRHSLRGVKVLEPLSSVQKEKMLSTPRRSLRNRFVIEECSDIIVLSDSDSQSKTFSSKHEQVDQPADQESVKEKHSLSVEPSSIVTTKLPATSQSTMNDAPDEMIDLTEDSMAEPQLKEQDQSKADNDDDNDDDNVSETADITNKDFPNAKASQSGKSDASNITERVEISLMLDSDESEDSEHSEEEEADVEMEQAVNQKELEEEKNHEGLEKKKHLKPTSTEQSKDLQGNGLFVIDTAPGLDSSKKYYVDHDVDDRESERDQSEKEELSEPEDELPEPDEEEHFIDEEVDDDDNEEDELLNKPKAGFDLSSRIDTGLNIKQLGGLYINFDAEKPNPGPSLINKMKKDSKKKDELLKKSVITPDFEKKDSVPPYRVSLHKLKKQRKEEREKTTGRGWFDMKAPEMTEELKNDLKALKMRSAMDPKHFYKKDDREGFPKYFQVATVVDNPLDYYHSRIPKKHRKRTIVEELLADSEFRRYNKKKYQEIMAEKAARAEGKKNRKKKKFRT